MTSLATPPLFLVKWLSCQSVRISRQRDAFATRYSLILVSFRGSAGSHDSLPLNNSLGTRNLDDLRAILDAEKLERVSLFGHCSCGANALAFAIYR